jgi:hypothetical protein
MRLSLWSIELQTIPINPLSRVYPTDFQVISGLKKGYIAGVIYPKSIPIACPKKYQGALLPRYSNLKGPALPIEDLIGT